MGFIPEVETPMDQILLMYFTSYHISNKILKCTLFPDCILFTLWSSFPLHTWFWCLEIKTAAIGRVWQNMHWESFAWSQQIGSWRMGQCHSMPGRSTHIWLKTEKLSWMRGFNAGASAVMMELSTLWHWSYWARTSMLGDQLSSWKFMLPRLQAPAIQTKGSPSIVLYTIDEIFHSLSLGKNDNICCPFYTHFHIC